MKKNKTNIIILASLILLVIGCNSYMNDRVKNINYNDSLKQDSIINRDSCIIC